MDETGIRQSQKIIEDNPDAPNLFRIDLPLSGSKSEKDVSDFFFQGGTATALQDIIMQTIKRQDNSMDNLEKFIDPKLSGDDIFNLHLTGVQESYYDNGQLCSRIHFKRGKKDGLYESWYLNGQQCERANYKRGKLDGVHLGWHSNGKVHELCNYKNGLLHGEYFKYDESGKLQVHTHCYKGYENLSAWKDSLTNKSVSPFKGEYEIWDDSLSPQPMAVFYMDKVSALEHQDQDLNDLSAQRIDPHVSENDIRPRQLNVIHGAYYDNGQLKERAISKAGKLDGLCERWHENGQLKERATYKAGKREGVCEEWRENGQLRSRREYSAGKREGVSETWYPNGRQQTRWNYKDDKLDGLCELWDSGGSLLTQTHYKDNKKNGLHLDYDPDSGKIYHWILFENDLSVKSGKPEELEQLEAYKNQAPKIVVPSSPVQEQAQAILDARGGDVKSTQKQEREAQVNKNSLKI
ncbi:MAG: hypothetical protein SOX65_05560 [Porphyromonas sp.]|uniref:toxin-antitoxin system YwqK family antitoxin n=1 Tax=Porphyromonas sp. TaxID=1924944 RepID=UPI002A81EDB5|nr:hypothetical protein [Porphyromonas sp.]MDY4245930.1 hypothetical protein [Porphyromonas sp.]